MGERSKVLLAGLGAPVKSSGEPLPYREIEWFDEGQSLGIISASFLFMAQRHSVEKIILIGTAQALDPERPHYQQIVADAQKCGFKKEQLYPVEISDLSNAGEFWKSFTIIVNSSLFERPVDLYVDLTFGYRIQPIMVFLVAFFLEEMQPERIDIKKIYYGMFDRKPYPEVVDFTELFELLQWIKASQAFTDAGNGKALLEKLARHLPQHSALVNRFSAFSTAYSFNRVADLQAAAKAFAAVYESKTEKTRLQQELPPLFLLSDSLDSFVESCTRGSALDVQLRLVKKNFKEGQYARSIILLRECYITVLAELFEIPDRKRLENKLINRVGIVRFGDGKSWMKEIEIQLADDIYALFCRIFSEETSESFFSTWWKVRYLRNASSHYVAESADTRDLVDSLADYLHSTEKLFATLLQQKQRARKEKKLLTTLLGNKLPQKNPVFLIINEGLHPIRPQLQEQFGSDIICEVISEGNIAIDEEAKLAAKAKELADRYRNHLIHIVPSGYPYMAVAVYNVIQQTTARHPVWLQFDKDQNRYHCKNLDPRAMLAGHLQSTGDK